MISLDKFEEKMLLTNGRKKEVALDTAFNHLETAVIHIANDSKNVQCNEMCQSI